ncbi:MAG: hypothetical protein ACR2JL_04270 [Candidatus Limnocylindrus sp.]
MRYTNFSSGIIPALYGRPSGSTTVTSSVLVTGGATQGTIAANSSNTKAYGYITITGASGAGAQSYDMELWSGNPDSDSSATAICYYTDGFDNIAGAPNTNANTVSSVTVNKTPVLNETFTVTVVGDTKNVGSGTSTTDNGATVLTPAALNDWPANAVRLEGLSMSITGLSTYNDTLAKVVTPPSNSTNPYTLVYTFRFIAGAPDGSNPKVYPVGRIPSGSQYKETDLTSTSLNLTFTLGQVVNVNAIANQKTSTSGITATATADSGLAISSYGTSTPSVCSVNSSTGVVTWSAGATVRTCTVTATQNGNTTYAAATGSTSFLIYLDQVITFVAPSTKTFGDANFSAGGTTNAASDGGSVTYSSSTTSVCTVSGSTIHIVSAGDCTITASAGATTNYAAATDVTRTFTINKATQTITALTNGSDGTTATYSSPNGTVTLSSSGGSGTGSVTYAKVSGDCTVVGTTVTITGGTNNCVVEATKAADTNYLAATDQVTITVAKATQTIDFGALAGKTYGDANFSVSSSASSGLAVTYDSNTPSVCTVTSSGTVTITGAGTCTIVASQPGNSNYLAAIDASQSFEVAPAAPTITFPQPPTKLINSTYTLTAYANSGGTIHYSTSTPDYCSVSGNVVTTLALIGDCTIDATVDAEGNYTSGGPETKTFSIVETILDIASIVYPNVIYMDPRNDFVDFPEPYLDSSENVALCIVADDVRADAMFDIGTRGSADSSAGGVAIRSDQSRTVSVTGPRSQALGKIASLRVKWSSGPAGIVDHAAISIVVYNAAVSALNFNCDNRKFYNGDGSLRNTPAGASASVTVNIRSLTLRGATSHAMLLR